MMPDHNVFPKPVMIRFSYGEVGILMSALGRYIMATSDEIEHAAKHDDHNAMALLRYQRDDAMDLATELRRAMMLRPKVSLSVVGHDPMHGEAE
jgi:hypothetical protein